MTVVDVVRNRVTAARSTRLPRRAVPILLLAVVIVYCMLGAGAFLCLEQPQHETGVRRWWLNLAVNRRQFARQISQRIFNESRTNLLIIIDREQTDRVQNLLVESLREYERQVDIRWPDKHDWNLLNSLNYAVGLITTVGHGNRVPATLLGQIFAFVYTLFGIPFFLASITFFVHRIVLPVFQRRHDSLARRLVHLQLAGLCFLLWLFLIAVFLFNFVEHGYWNSLFAAGLTLLTVQIGNYERLTSLNLFAVLMATAVSIGLAALVVLLLVRVQKERERRRTVRIGDSTGMGLPSENQPAKFVMVVDEAGESKLAE